MTLERLQALATARIPDLDCAVVRRRRQPCRVGREGHRVDRITMALERLQVLATTRIPDLDRLVARRRRQPCRVGREGHRVDIAAMALKRLQAGTPFISYSRLYCDLLWLFLFKKVLY